MGEDLGQQRPGDRAEGHGIDRDGRHYQRHHQHARHTQEVAGAQGEIDEPQAACSDEHERAPSPFLDGVEGDDGEHHIGDARDDNVDEHAVDVEACSHEDLLCIVEDDIGATPLLEHGDEETQ